MVDRNLTNAGVWFLSEIKQVTTESLQAKENLLKIVLTIKIS